MARAIWKGRLILGAHEVPVKMYSAVEDRKVHFRLLHAEDLSPVEQRIVRKSDGEEVPKEERLKAFPLSDGNAVILRPEELEALEPPPSRDINLCRFVHRSLISDQWYDRPYYLGPDEDAEGYFALVDALSGKELLGVARWVMRKKRYVGALGVFEGYLLINTLRRGDQVLSVSGIDTPGARAVDEREQKLADQLIAAVSADFEPALWEDQYRQRVSGLIQAKLRGERVKAEEPGRPRKGGRLSERLRQSLAVLGERKDSNGNRRGERTTERKVA